MMLLGMDLNSGAQFDLVVMPLVLIVMVALIYAFRRPLARMVEVEVEDEHGEPEVVRRHRLSEHEEQLVFEIERRRDGEQSAHDRRLKRQLGLYGDRA